jgi:hypothetical protein
MEHREFLSVIGRKGGLAGKGSPRKKMAAKQAAETRWRKEHPVPKKPMLDSNKQLV